MFMFTHLISSKAWDVPNSNLIVNLKKMGYLSNDSYYYVVGVSTRNPRGVGAGYSMFNERGGDPYEAFENLMAKIDKGVDIIFKIVDACENGESVKTVTGHRYDGMPVMNEDFSMQFFSSLPRLISMAEKNDGFVFEIRKVEMERGHVTNYGVIRVGEEILFKGKPAYDRNAVLENMRNAVLGAAAMLEKFQGMAWNVMIDSSDSEYDVVGSKTGLVLRKRNAEEVENV